MKERIARIESDVDKFVRKHTQETTETAVCPQGEADLEASGMSVQALAAQEFRCPVCEGTSYHTFVVRAVLVPNEGNHEAYDEDEDKTTRAFLVCDGCSFMFREPRKAREVWWSKRFC